MKVSQAVRPKSLIPASRSNRHALTKSTKFWPLLRPLLLRPSFWIEKCTPPRLHSIKFWPRALTSMIWSRRGEACTLAEKLK